MALLVFASSFFVPRFTFDLVFCLTLSLVSLLGAQVGGILNNPIQDLSFNLLTISYPACHLNPFCEIANVSLLLHWPARSVLFLALQPAEKVGKHEGESGASKFDERKLCAMNARRSPFQGFELWISRTWRWIMQQIRRLRLDSLQIY